MTTPFFVLYDENRTPWHITATNGLAFENKPKKINLWDHVIVKQMPGPKSDETILKTPEMTYYPDTAFAHSDKAVTIQQPGSIMHSIGFDAYLKKSLIKFLSRSETQYHDPGTGKSDSGNPLNVM